MDMPKLIVAAALALLPVTAEAQDYTAGSVRIGRPWSRMPPPAAKAAVGFMTLSNIGKEADRLIGGTVSIAGKFEMHAVAVVDGVMQMRELAEGFEIKPGETVQFKPGSHHMMFVGLNQQPKAGDRIKGSLVFEKAGSIEIEYKVEPMGARGTSQ
jgi:copper(I)-binding protein